jgi:hypothetical protein
MLPMQETSFQQDNSLVRYVSDSTLEICFKYEVDATGFTLKVFEHYLN